MMTTKQILAAVSCAYLLAGHTHGASASGDDDRAVFATVLQHFLHQEITVQIYDAPGVPASNRTEVVVFDLTGPSLPTLAGLEKPILNELHPELDFGK